ncbi:MAG: hypothetical protein CMO01_00885 [Thalassobius sp.]|nr:hypothetical protein [Thalassovita sp.]
MSIINSIRNKSGLLLIVIGVAMLAFILGDLFSRNFLSQGNERIVGEIAGEEIPFEEFSREFDEFRQNYEMNIGRALTEQELPGIRQQAWNQLVFKKAYFKEFEKLGLAVTDEEMIDMIQGNNIDPSWASLFTNPETGEIDRNNIRSFLQNIESVPPQSQAFYINFERNLRPNRLRAKYENLLAETYFATDAEAKKEYEAQNSKADVRYAYVPYSTIPDSAVSVSESEMRDYYNDHKKEFDSDATISLEYVTFPIQPSDMDLEAIKEELEDLKTPFANTQNDTAFTAANSETNNNFIVAKPNSLPQGLNIGDFEKGKVFGPVKDGDFYKLYKVLDIVNDSVAYAKARHILIKTGDDKDAAKAKATKILNDIKGGADFAQMAAANGEDGTKSRGGDLGWFDENAMVEPFGKAVFNAKSTGLLPSLIETDFGYHIIEVTHTKIYDNFNLAVIEKEIAASDDTRSEVYRRTGAFAVDRTKENFISASEADSSLIRYQALNINKNSRSINNIYDPGVRTIITWAFREAEVGDVSETLELEDQFVIALLTEKTEDGISSFESVKNSIKTKLAKEKKKEQILAKMKGLSGTLDQIKDGYGSGATIGQATAISLNTTSLPSVGFAPKAIGQIFKMETGQTSEPIADENGVLVVEVDQMDKASEIAEYSLYKDQIQSKYGNINQVSAKIAQAMNEFAEVENDIYKYY